MSVSRRLHPSSAPPVFGNNERVASPWTDDPDDCRGRRELALSCVTPFARCRGFGRNRRAAQSCVPSRSLARDQFVGFVFFHFRSRRMRFFGES